MPFLCYSALTLLVWCQEEHPACKKLNDGIVICVERGADCLHMVQLMPLHPKTPFKSRLLLPFWYRLTQVVLEKRPLNVCVCFMPFSVLDFGMYDTCEGMNLIHLA